MASSIPLQSQNQGCHEPTPHLPAPAGEPEDGSPRNLGNQLRVPQLPFMSSARLPPSFTPPALPNPRSSPASTSPPSPHSSRIPEGNLDWRQYSVPVGGVRGRSQRAGVGLGRSGGQNSRPREEAQEGQRLPERMSPFRVGKEGGKTLSGV